ncbi:hypothetical protein [Streptomyces sp900129855]|jgi:ABC-type arginine transport system permease subunit|uniref:Uncharacterized protein n=1 Tax=Streptomyces sp. 900129855 TaxID=3155129 RepID=A0ABV2ZVI6_9ACTN
MIEFPAERIITTVQVMQVMQVTLGALVTVAQRSPMKTVCAVGGIHVAVLRGAPPVAWLLVAYYGFASREPASAQARSSPMTNRSAGSRQLIVEPDDGYSGPRATTP